MAKQFVEHLRSEAPQPGQGYEVTQDDGILEGDDILIRESEGDPENDLYGKKRKWPEEEGTPGSPSKAARVQEQQFNFEY